MKTFPAKPAEIVLKSQFLLLLYLSVYKIYYNFLKLLRRRFKPGQIGCSKRWNNRWSSLKISSGQSLEEYHPYEVEIAAKYNFKYLKLYNNLGSTVENWYKVDKLKHCEGYLQKQ